MSKPTSLLTCALMDVEAFVTHLDVTKTTCECCNVVRYVNFDEFKAAQELNGVANKLRRFIEHFDTKNGGTSLS